jgi:hypothetical protein
MKFATSILISLFLFSGTGTTSALAQAPVSGCSIPGFPAPTLCARAGLDTVPASYLFIVDESGSMRPLWTGVRSALAQFAAAVPDGNELDVRLFATTTRGLIPATQATAQTRSLWSAEIGALPPPRGQHTDLGLAARAAIERLRSAPADRLQFVFFLTDGIHDPGPGSPFARSWDATWETLAQEAANLQRSRPIKVGIVRLDRQADVTFLSRVFPEAIVTDAMSSQALSQWFTNLTSEAAVSKLKLLLERDLAQPAAIVAADGPLRTYQGRSTRHKLRLRSERGIVSSTIAAGTEITLPDGGRAVFEESFTLDPHEERPVPVQLTDRAYPFFLPPGIRARDLSDEGAVSVGLEPASELTLIGENASGPSTVRFNMALAGGGMLSWPAWITAVVALLLALGYLGLRTRWAIHRAYLPGRVIVVHASGAGEETVVFRGLRKKSHTVIHPDGRSSVQLNARSERGRTVVYASAAGDAVSSDGKRIVAPVPIKRVTRFESESGEITYLPN